MKQAIRHHGGGSTIETKKGILDLFANSCDLPRFQPSVDVEEKGSGGEVVWCGPDCRNRKLRVLVADDCHDTADSLSTLVKIWGHQVWVAYDGAAALETASAFQADVLVLDIAMPRMDGYQVARQIRRNARLNDTLLIAMTGWADQLHLILGNEAGFDHYLIKPLGTSTLKAMLAIEQGRLTNSAALRTPRALAHAGNGP